MNTLVIEEKLINLDKIHFVRRESRTELLISFGTDYLRFRGEPQEIEEIFYKIDAANEKLSGPSKRKRTVD